MKRSALGFSILSIGLLAGLWFAAGPPATPDDLTHVRVTNFPPLQQIAGKVEIEEPIRQAELIALREIVLPPVLGTQTTRWVDAGRIDTAGFPSIVLSLHGEIKGNITHSGAIAGVLIPDEPSILAAFNEEGLVHFALNVVANDARGGIPYFASGQPRYTVGFSAYRVFLYNETDKTVSANLFAYLTN